LGVNLRRHRGRLPRRITLWARQAAIARTICPATRRLKKRLWEANLQGRRRFIGRLTPRAHGRTRRSFLDQHPHLHALPGIRILRIRGRALQPYGAEGQRAFARCCHRRQSARPRSRVASSRLNFWAAGSWARNSSVVSSLCDSMTGFLVGRSYSRSGGKSGEMTC